MVVDVDFDHMQEWIQKAGQLTDDQKNYKQSHVWLGSIKPTTNIPDGVIIVNKQVVWKGGVVGIAAETIKANLRQYAAQIQPIQTAPDTANAASGNQQQEQGQEQDQNQNQGQNQNIQNNQPFTVELGDEFNKQTFTVKYDALGKAVQLLDPYGRTIDLANQSEIFAGANQYKVEKDSSGAVSHLLLCQENMGCQRIPLYR